MEDGFDNLAEYLDDPSLSNDSLWDPCQVPTGNPVLPRIDSIGLDVHEIMESGDVTVSWVTQCADTVRLEPGAQTVAAAGSQAFTGIAESTWFTIIAANANAQVMKSDEVEVYELFQSNDYDTGNQRVRRVVDGVERLFIYGPGGGVLAELDSVGDPIVEYVYLEGEPLAQIHGAPGASSTYYVHASHLGTPELMTGGSAGGPQDVAWEAKTYPFGDEFSTYAATGVTQSAGFPGQLTDQDSRLSYNWHRYYDPSLGRYISADPIGQAGGVNVYSYALNNPVRYIDPFGLEFRVVGRPGPARDRVQAALERFRSTPRGQEIEAAAPDTDIVVNDRGWNQFNRPGLPGDILIDPDAPACVETEDGPQDTPLEARIAHEGGHALGDHDDGPGGMNNVNRNENPVRSALGYPERTKYPFPSGDQGCTCSEPR
ncbi:MAG: RHS repeat-associated core domain-containing protein [Myxococcota bacterium]